MDITISSYDISDFEERLERSFDIRNGWGSEAVNDQNEIATFDELGFGFPNGTVQAVLQQQQEVIKRLDGAMSLIYERNRKLEHEVLDIKIALRNANDAFSKIDPSKDWNEGEDKKIKKGEKK